MLIEKKIIHEINNHFKNNYKSMHMSMECCSIVIIAAFGPGDLGSNPGWFAVSNSN